MAACYPLKAQRMSVDGDAVIQCTATNEGALADCRVIREHPEGLGFGAQAVSCLSPLFKIAPLDQDGVPVAGGTISIGIKFHLPAHAPGNSAGN